MSGTLEMRCAGRREPTDAPANHGHVHALGCILFATVLGDRFGATEPELRPLWERLEREWDDALAMSELLEELRGRAELVEADPASLAGLAQSWVNGYMSRSGRHTVAIALLEEVGAIARASASAAALELDLLLLAAELCEGARDWKGGARLARLGLERASERGLDQGARASRLTSLLGRFALEEGRLDDAITFLGPSYESLWVLEGPSAATTLAALRRLVDAHAARSELVIGARLAAEASGQILLRSDASASLLDELAYYALVAPDLERALTERALHASELAVQKSPGEARFLATRALGLVRLERTDEALAVLARARELPELAGPLRARHLGVLALALARSGRIEEARSALSEVDALAADPNLSRTTRQLLGEVRLALESR